MKNNNINTKEQWAWITGYEDRYMVSTLGQIKSFVVDKVDGKLMKLINDKNGYKKINLYKNGKKTTFQVHRLVAIAFIPNPENKPQVNHIDEDKTNNNVSNLEWVTAKENTNHGTRNVRSGESISKAVRNITTGVVYKSQTAAAAELGLIQGSISRCCSGRRKTTGDFEWEYVQE